MLDYKIRTFLSLCQHMNYRITAESLNMTQPAVTNHIQQLEHEYGCKLFIYKNRVLYKTDKANLLWQYAQSAEYNEKKLIEELLDSGEIKLRIGATKTIGEYILNTRIIELLRQNDINLTYKINNTENLLNDLRHGNLDYVFIEGFLNRDEFTHYSYKREELVGICAKNHNFAGRDISFNELFSERLILREEGSGTGEAFKRILTEHNYTTDKFDSKIVTSSFKAITEFIIAGLGISFVYESVAKSSDSISTFRIKNVRSFHEFTCVHLKNITKPIFIETLLDASM